MSETSEPTRSNCRSATQFSIPRRSFTLASRIWRDREALDVVGYERLFVIALGEHGVANGGFQRGVGEKGVGGIASAMTQ
jgi:hypothetical protein